jgi:MFS family permease
MTGHRVAVVEPRSRVESAFALGPVLVVAAVAVVGLLIVSGSYGLHRDELYFIVAGRHPDWGYVDQPPITPLLSAASAAVFGIWTTGIRILPALVFGGAVVLTASIAKELGGSRRAQVIASVTLALSGFLLAGHMNTTATYDVLGWMIVLWLTIRLLRGADPCLWLAAGLAAGLTLQNKNLILFLAAGLGAGLLLARRWDVFRSRWMWAGALVAVAVWLPNLAWQAAHDWPQLEMARQIASRSGDENRTMLIPMQLLFSGLLPFPIPVAGLAWLLRSSRATPWRPIGLAYLVVLVLLFVTSGKGYYAGGMLPILMAAGAIVADGWLDRGRSALRRSAFIAAAAGSGVITSLLLLPLIPLATLGSTAIPSLVSDTGNQVGWPGLVDTVSQVVDELAPTDRARAAIFTSNYGEAGALELLGVDLPPVYSGHNSYADWGPPPEDLTLTILVASWPGAETYYGQWLGPCERRATIDNGYGIESEEQGAGVWVCSRRPVPWLEAWPQMRHIG